MSKLFRLESVYGIPNVTFHRGCLIGALYEHCRGLANKDIQIAEPFAYIRSRYIFHYIWMTT